MNYDITTHSLTFVKTPPSKPPHTKEKPFLHPRIHSQNLRSVSVSRPQKAIDTDSLLWDFESAPNPPHLKKSFVCFCLFFGFCFFSLFFGHLRLVQPLPSSGTSNLENMLTHRPPPLRRGAVRTLSGFTSSYLRCYDLVYLKLLNYLECELIATVHFDKYLNSLL